MLVGFIMHFQCTHAWRIVLSWKERNRRRVCICMGWRLCSVGRKQVSPLANKRANLSSTIRLTPGKLSALRHRPTRCWWWRSCRLMRLHHWNGRWHCPNSTSHQLQSLWRVSAKRKRMFAVVQRNSILFAWSFNCEFLENTSTCWVLLILTQNSV